MGKIFFSFFWWCFPIWCFTGVLLLVVCFFLLIHFFMLIIWYSNQGEIVFLAQKNLQMISINKGYSWLDLTWLDSFCWEYGNFLSWLSLLSLLTYLLTLYDCYLERNINLLNINFIFILFFYQDINSSIWSSLSFFL